MTNKRKSRAKYCTTSDWPGGEGCLCPDCKVIFIAEIASGSAYSHANEECRCPSCKAHGPIIGQTYGRDGFFTIHRRPGEDENAIMKFLRGGRWHIRRFKWSATDELLSRDRGKRRDDSLRIAKRLAKNTSFVSQGRHNDPDAVVEFAQRARKGPKQLNDLRKADLVSAVDRFISKGENLSDASSLARHELQINRKPATIERIWRTSRKHQRRVQLESNNC